MRTLIILTILISSCAPSLYHVTTDTTFEQMENLPFKRKLIYLSQDIGTLSKLDSLATSMNKKKWKNFDERIKVFPEEDQQFLRSIKFLISDEFLTSYNTLDSLEDANYDCQVGLLKTDCMYELSADSVDFKGNYQNSMNCTKSEIIKSIINTRYRFLRYGQ
ncbi:MAG: hypothetical protein RH948_19375 [Cyclobacteriaceae bacterium]